MIENIVLISGNEFSCGEVYSGSILDGKVMVIQYGQSSLCYVASFTACWECR